MNSLADDGLERSRATERAHLRRYRLRYLVRIALALAAGTMSSAPRVIRAQAPALRFQTDESYRLIIQTLYGPVSITISGTSELNIRQVRADSLVLTYTRMDVEQFCICGHITVDTKALVGRPIALRVEPSGRVRVLSGTKGDDAGGTMTNPASGFGGMLIRFPPNLLAVGAQWADSVVENRGDGEKRGAGAATVQRTGHYRVAADTTIDGTGAWLITVNERLHQVERLKSAKKGVEGTMSVDGDDTGWVAFAKDGSGLVHRVEHASLEGILEIPASGGNGAKAAPVKIVFDVTRTRLP